MSRNEIKALAAIRRYCKECSGGSELEARRCTLTECPLHKFRFGASREVKEELKKSTK